MTGTINIPTKIRTYSNYCMFDTTSQIPGNITNYENPKVQKFKSIFSKVCRENRQKPRTSKGKYSNIVRSN